MKIDSLISPGRVLVRDDPFRSSSNHVRGATPELRSWCDLAIERDWEGAILEFLRGRWRQAVPLWTVVNSVCAEALPQTRRETRELKREILESLGQLILAKRVLRWKRSHLAILDIGHPVIPLEQLRHKRLAGDKFPCPAA